MQDESSSPSSALRDFSSSAEGEGINGEEAMTLGDMGAGRPEEVLVVDPYHRHALQMREMGISDDAFLPRGIICVKSIIHNILVKSSDFCSFPELSIVLFKKIHI